jgi:hypothetical protein
MLAKSSQKPERKSMVVVIPIGQLPRAQRKAENRSGGTKEKIVGTHFVACTIIVV